MCGEYLDALPGRWLCGTARGPFGPMRYACAEHRGDLTAYLREHYGTLGRHPWKMPPYPITRRSRDTDARCASGAVAGVELGAAGVTAEDDVLARPVHAGGADRRFGELSVDDVRGHAAELRSAAGWGPTARIATVATAWRGWPTTWRRPARPPSPTSGAPRAAAMAERLWVVPPGGSLLR